MLSRIPIRAFSQAHKDAGLKFDGSKALPASLVRPFPGLGGIRFEGNVATSNFNSLQVAVNRRFSRGFSYSIAYTWSKAIGVAAGDGDLSTLSTSGSMITGCWISTARTPSPRLTSMMCRSWAEIGRQPLHPRPARRVADFRHHFADQRQSVRLGVGVGGGVNANQRITGSWTEPSRFRLKAIEERPERIVDQSDRVHHP